MNCFSLEKDDLLTGQGYGLFNDKTAGQCLIKDNKIDVPGLHPQKRSGFNIYGNAVLPGIENFIHGCVGRINGKRHIAAHADHILNVDTDRGGCSARNTCTRNDKCAVCLVDTDQTVIDVQADVNKGNGHHIYVIGGFHLPVRSCGPHFCKIKITGKFVGSDYQFYVVSGHLYIGLVDFKAECSIQADSRPRVKGNVRRCRTGQAPAG